MKTKGFIIAVLIVGLGLAPSLNASEKGLSGKMPNTLGGIWQEIGEKQKELGDLIKDKKLDKVHEVAFVIRDLAKLLPDKSPDLSADNQKKLKSWVDGIADSAERLGVVEVAACGVKRRVDENGPKTPAEFRARTRHHSRCAGRPPIEACDTLTVGFAVKGEAMVEELSTWTS